jgi:DNA invertase Pin-like site-specific DNA recombinase
MNRYYAYVRVSTARQGEHGVSLIEQRAAIERYASQHRLAIAEWFEERETAAKTGRAEFGRLMRGLKRGVADGVILHKIDRGARNLRDWADIADLSDMGVDVRFTTETYDLRSRGGRLAADVQAVVAADYIRNLREETKKGMYGRLKQGFFPLRAPVGYLDCGSAKPKVPDPERAPFVKLAFELYSSGRFGLDELLEELTRRGFRNRNGKPLRRNGLSVLLNNPFYVGVIRINKTGEFFDGKHEPLIDRRLFGAAQNILRGRTPRRGGRTQHPYSRLIQCSRCGHSLIAEVQKGHRYYRCQGTSCRGVCVREESIDAAVSTALAPVSLTGAIARQVLPLATRLIAEDESAMAERRNALALTEQAITDRLGRLTDAFLDGSVDKATYEERKADIFLKRREVIEQRVAVDAGRTAIPARIARFLELLQSPLLLANRANATERREILLALTSNRSVTGKNLAITLAEPFASLSKRPELLNCRPCRTGHRTTARAWARAIAEWVKTDTTDYPWLHDQTFERVDAPTKVYAFHRARSGA